MDRRWASTLAFIGFRSEIVESVSLWWNVHRRLVGAWASK
ncbi:unnamed protein product [Acidithrix sp. C25]|nr:unnamed protein product [Acidithrix sp. C25]